MLRVNQAKEKDTPSYVLNVRSSVFSDGVSRRKKCIETDFITSSLFMIPSSLELHIIFIAKQDCLRLPSARDIGT